MQLLLIRHASRERVSSNAASSAEDAAAPLSSTGEIDVAKLASTLVWRDLKPAFYLTSTHEHAKETGRRLADLVAHYTGDTPAPVLHLDALTPKRGQVTPPPPQTFTDILTEARQKHGLDFQTLGELEVVALVGHHPRLSQLLQSLTSQRARYLNPAEAVCVRARSLLELQLGNGDVRIRLPMDYQEEQLRPKIQSKMTISTLLAGFTFTALFELVKAPGSLSSLIQSAAVVCLVASLVLFIASIYMYDRLSMPEVFWADDDRPRVLGQRRKVLQRLHGKQFEQDRVNIERGILYAYMVWTWQRVFTPAVFLAVAGLMLILVNTSGIVNQSMHNVFQFLQPNPGPGLWLIVILVVIVVIWLYYRMTRPRFGTRD